MCYCDKLNIILVLKSWWGKNKFHQALPSVRGYYFV